MDYEDYTPNENIKDAEKVDENKEYLEQIKLLEQQIKPYLTSEALYRLNNLKIAHPKKWYSALLIIAQLINSGQVSKIDESLLKKILQSFTPKKREPKIRFFRR